MTTLDYVLQECPTCGRNLRVRTEYLGKQVVCQHCGAQFQAMDTQDGSASALDSGSDILKRADQLLDSVKLRRR